VLITWGVPQGSRIGPVAFVVHINGLPLVLKQPEINHGDVSEVSEILMMM
jgi:hypothetical protein